MTESAHPVLTAAARYRAALLANEDAATRRLVAAYGSAYQRLGVQIAALREILTDEPLTRKRAGDLVQLVALRRQIAEEIGRFGVIADNELAQSSRQAIDLGLQHSLGLAQAYFTSPQGKQALTGAFQMLAPAQVETLVGFLADDSPLRQGLTAQLGPTVAERVSDRLIDGMVRGFNPNKTAGIVRKELGVGLAWAINTTRTANLWAYRAATRANYAANPRIVSGWIWYATLDGRVCGNCLSQHGSRHPLGETLNGHHQCRCAMLPILPMAATLGISEPEIEPGETWFRRQDETLQRDILGPGMLAAYNAGDVAFDQFKGHTYEHPAYGTMQRMPSMAQLGLERYYTGPTERSTDRRVETPSRATGAPLTERPRDVVVLSGAETPRYRAPDSTIDNVIRLQDREIAEILAPSAGVTPEQYVATIEQAFRQLVENHSLAIQFSSDYIDLLLADPRFKTQFETNRSGGTNDQDLRARAEENGLGVPYGIDPKLRPIYGYLNLGKRAREATTQYGDLTFILNDTVRDRTTVTLGDSLYNLRERRVAGTPIRSPGREGADGFMDSLREYAQTGDVNAILDEISYVELQIHGGVGLVNVRGVIDEQGRLTTAQRQRLQEQGVEVWNKAP